jgi:hypothetical protein
MRHAKLAFVALFVSASSLAFASGCSVRLGDGEGEASGEASGSATGTGNGQALAYFPPEKPTVPSPTSHCTPAPALFAQAAVCVCGSMSHAGKLTTIARPGESADVGIFGGFSGASGTRIDGSLRTAEGVSFAGDVDVRDHLYSAADVSGAGTLSVGGDLAVKGDLSGAGSLRVGGALRVGQSTSFAGRTSVGQKAQFVDPGMAPCGCDKASLYDVAGAVTAAREQNDNAKADLPLDANNLVGKTQLTLGQGRYYLSGATAVGKLRVRVEGAVQLYLDGELTTVGEGQFTLAPGATLDLFVNGALTTVGHATFGDPSRPEAFRLYVGGKNASISFAGKDAFHGLLYAPEAKIAFAGGAVVDGALYAGELSYAGDLTVRAARVSVQGSSCEEPTKSPASPTPVPAPAEAR